MYDAPNFYFNEYGCRSVFMDVTSATNTRTVISTCVPFTPCGNKVPILQSGLGLILPGVMSSFAVDFEARRRITGLTLNYFILSEIGLPIGANDALSLRCLLLRIMACDDLFASTWLLRGFGSVQEALRVLWGLTVHERMRLKCVVDALCFALFGFESRDVDFVLAGTEKRGINSVSNDPKGFWRVDKDKNPELRHTVLTLVAFHDLEDKIRECGGDQEKGIEGFLNQNNREGWMLPETLRLADYGLGHDERAKEHQPVASRLGPRFYDWQLAQSSEESWRECHIHARNLLGERGYLELLGEVLANAPEGGWAEALTFACELSKKENLLLVFEAALGALPSASWRNRSNEARSIMAERGFTLEQDDRIQILFGATGRVAEAKRSEALKACGDILDSDAYLTVMQRLLAIEPGTPDGPWHILIREVLGPVAYRTLIAALQTQAHTGVAEPSASYDITKVKQGRLFD